MSGLTIVTIPPQDLHQHWPLLRYAIEKIISKLGTRNVDFIPEDVYASIRAGTSILYVATHGQRTLGYSVAYVQRRPFSNKPELYWWLAWNLHLAWRLPDDNLLQATLMMRDHLIKVARDAGCDRIRQLSNRKGFEKYGFKPTLTVWEYEL